jgi:RHS repeat-associated protein
MSEKSYLPSGVFLLCDKGVLPTPLTVTWATTTDFLGTNVATERDKMPGVNVIPFGACAATYGPCVPMPLAWNPVKNDVVVHGARPLLEDSKLPCSRGGTISVFLSMSAALLRVASTANDALNASVDGAIKNVEDGVAHQFDKADDYLKQLGPPLGDYAREKLGMAEGVWEGASGIVTGLWGLSKMARNLELKTANAVSYAVEHPAETGAALQQGAQRGWSAVTNADNWRKAGQVAYDLSPVGMATNTATWMSDPANRAKAWNVSKAAYAKASTYMADPRNRGKFVGRAGFEVAFAVLTGGAGEAANVGKVGEVANALEKGEAAVQSGRVLTGAVEETAAIAAKREAAELAEREAVQKLETEAAECAAKNKCTVKGEPVDVATGRMFTEAIDVELPGPIPFVWERTWYSTSERRGPLGHGWHHGYDQALWQDAAGRWYLREAEGRLVTFGLLDQANAFRAFNRAEQLELFPAPDAPGTYHVFSRRQQLTYCFAANPVATAVSAGPLPLLAIRNGGGQAIRFAYSAAGHLCGITDSAERPIGVRTDAEGRIVALDLPLPDGTPSTFAAVQYTYDATGHLIAATDAEGHTEHFAYQLSSHLLTTRTFRNDTSFYFEYDAQRRCTYTWSAEGYLSYRFAYGEGHTVVTTDEPATQQEYWHTQGLVTRHLDPVGSLHEWYYNAHGELELARDPLGQATLYDYDGQGNLVKITRPDGATEQTQYNEQGQLLVATDGNGGQWQCHYTETGQLAARTDPTGATTRFAYDSQGRLAELTDALGHATRLRYDAQHNLTHLVAPDDSIRLRAYDALGRVVALTDANGHVQQRHYDRLGQLVAQQKPTGEVQQLTYDAMGSVVRTTNGPQEITYAYSPLGQLSLRQQGGQQVQFAYNHEGQLTQVRNEVGETYQFQLNAAGQVAQEIGFDGLTRRYERDLAGRVTYVERPAGRTTAYAYNGTGQVAEVVHNGTERTTFRYRADGVLLEAATDTTTVTYERDALGRVVREVQDGYDIRSTYNALGQRLELSSSLGAQVNLERDALGQVRQTTAGAWQSLVGRDAEGLELHRQLSGGLRQDWEHDAAGRPTSQRLSLGSRVERRRRYRWQGADQLTEIEDSVAGPTRYTYDALGSLTGAVYANGTQDVRQPDAVGNLFRTAARTDRTYGPGGQLQRAGGMRYQYDAEGNLTRKALPDGQQWHYAWDGAGQLAKVTRPDGYAVTFAYDALGRRVSKRFRGRVTKWVWDGDKPLHEWTELEVGPGAGSAGEVLTWLFEEDSFAPLAKLTTQGAYSVVCDHLGTPLSLHDAQGVTTWELQLDSYGSVRQGRGRAQDCPFRYQGQYEDVETGLYYNRFRYFDPQTGAYISQDPIGLEGNKSNLYGYVDDPTTYVDVFGLNGRYHGPKPKYTNPGHHEWGNPKFRGGGDKTSIMPKNADEIYKSAIPDAQGKHWYAKDGNGVIHRFGNSNDGTVHWNGDSSQGRGVEVPKEVKSRFSNPESYRTAPKAICGRP